MGSLVYGAPSTEVTFEDRALAHLQIVIMAKLRRREGFMFTWITPAEAGSGRMIIWLHPSIPLVFRFAGSRPPAINREWIDVLVASSNAPGGLVFSLESKLETSAVSQ